MYFSSFFPSGAFHEKQRKSRDQLKYLRESHLIVKTTLFPDDELTLGQLAGKGRLVKRELEPTSLKTDEVHSFCLWAEKPFRMSLEFFSFFSTLDILSFTFSLSLTQN